MPKEPVPPVMRTEDPSRIATSQSLTALPWDHGRVQDLVLGTAQWGNAYGITNAVGRLSDASLGEIVDTAHRFGIRYVDTAAAYGDAELRLRPWASQFAVSTKAVGSGPRSVTDQLMSSLDRLGVERLRACLLHDWPTLSVDEASSAVTELERLEAEGLVGRIGVSAYDEDDLRRAIEVFGTLGCVQVPVSALDRRLGQADLVRELVDLGTEIQARSVLLQGLLAQRSSSGLGTHPQVVRFHDACEAEGVSGLQAALSYVKALGWVAEVVVGATSSDELDEVASAWAAPGGWYPEPASALDLDLVDPRRWA